MLYNNFIACTRSHETEFVKGLYFESCCAMETIPDSICSLIPQLICLLQKQRLMIGSQNQVMYLFGLQVCSVVPNSNNQDMTDLIVHSKYPAQSLYYVLKYLLLERNLKKPDTWDHEHNLVVNFNSGDVMDNLYYLSLVFEQKPQGTLYGNFYDQDQSRKYSHETQTASPLKQRKIP